MRKERERARRVASPREEKQREEGGGEENELGLRCLGFRLCDGPLELR